MVPKNTEIASSAGVLSQQQIAASVPAALSGKTELAQNLPAAPARPQIAPSAAGGISTRDWGAESRRSSDAASKAAAYLLLGGNWAERPAVAAALESISDVESIAVGKLIEAVVLAQRGRRRTESRAHVLGAIASWAASWSWERGMGFRREDEL